MPTTNRQSGYAEGRPCNGTPLGRVTFYTWAQIAGILIFSIYAPPRLSHEEFTGLLSNIVDEARGKTPILVAGDFYAWSTGSRETKPRGEAFLDAFSTPGCPSAEHRFKTDVYALSELAAVRHETICRERVRAAARDGLHRAIKASKRLLLEAALHEELIAMCVVGKPYRVDVMYPPAGQPRTSPPLRAAELVRRSSVHAIPDDRSLGRSMLSTSTGGTLIPEVGVEELRWAYGRVRIGAARPAQTESLIPPSGSGWRHVFEKGELPPRLHGVPQEGCFPTRWKRQRARLVLMLKPGKPAMEPSSYRPLCMLDTAGKIRRKDHSWSRLETHTEGPAGLADSQYGFRKGRSTVDAIQAVLSTARSAISGKRWHRGTKEYCAIITLDVRNAFNSARWNKILIALSQMEVPAYLLRIVSSYFLDRVLEFTTDDGSETYEVTAGVPQESLLGPILWNVMYDRILRLKLPRSAKIVGFADDIAVTVVAKHLDLVEFYSNETIRLVRAALTDLGLQTADQKTEVLLVTSRKVRETITLRAGDHYITSAPCIRYFRREFSRFVFSQPGGRACARGGAGTTQKEDPGYDIILRTVKNPITVRAGSDRITISRSPRRGLTRLAIDGAQHSHDEVRSENHTHKRAPDAGAKAQQERMMAPEARTTLTR
ncbi:unnamed protein product [Trichogramma brassicae]|uniref:Reverse transcriptase domain-containing protein n=1 Tax=Trichogramma brassicae TaxID=86971 RepID=A0A6H5I763_9HYME|nr:unnamed protein product [Trichogramma brassicae]